MGLRDLLLGVDQSRTWRDDLKDAASAESDDDAAGLVVDCICRLLRSDPSGALATRRRLRRVWRAFVDSGRKWQHLR